MHHRARQMTLRVCFALLVITLGPLTRARRAHAIIGGGQASLGEYPWIAQISLAGTGHECGGALLASTWVLTAAHCVFGKTKEQVTVTLGEYDRTWPDLTEQVRSVAEIVKHPHAIDGNDIVLLRLSSAVTFNAFVQPIEVASGDYATGTTATLAGWGHTAFGGPTSNALKEVSFPIVSNETCAPAMTATGDLQAKMVCAGVLPNGASGCDGDSGGPVVVSDGFGGKLLIGIVSWGGMSCKPFTVSVRARDYKPWIDEKINARPPICSGRTAPGDTEWLDGGTDVLHTFVDTTPCGWASTPLYFTSLGGNTGHDTIDAANAIYQPTNKGFRVFLYKSGLTAAQAKDRDYHINWQSIANNTNILGVCSGKSPTNTWVQHQTDVIYTDVNTSACGLFSTPSYFTSIGGLDGHALARGATSVAAPTRNRFRVYVQRTGATPSSAQSLGWHIVWRAEAPLVNFDDLCNGATTAGSTNWVQDGTDRVYTNVNTSACFIPTVPKYFSVLGGTTTPWLPRSVTSIFAPTADGFRVYLTSSGLTPSKANQNAWHVRWNALP